MQKPRLASTHFHCPKCDTLKVVETVGIIVSGPVCDVCRRSMRRIEIRQLDLGLFRNDKRRNK